MTRNVLFVGGTGFIGKTFLDYFLAAAAGTPVIRLTITSRDPAAFLASNRELAARLGDRVELIQQALPHLTPCGRYDAIVHGAETPTASFGEADLLHSIAAMDDLLRFAGQTGVRRIVYLSSGAVYRVDDRLAPPYDAGTNLSDRVGEHDRYARAKFLNERALREFAMQTGVEHAIVRIFNVASRHVPLSGRFALGNFVRDMLDPAVDAIDIRSSGRDRRSFIDGGSLGALIEHCFDTAPDGAVYNACGFDTMTILDLATMVREITGIDKPIRILAPDAATHDYTGIANGPAGCLGMPGDVRDAIADLVAVAGSNAATRIVA